MVLDERLELTQALDSLGFAREKGWKHDGLYTSTEIVERVEEYGLVQPIGSFLRYLVDNDLGNEGKQAHEVLHCFDVGLGAAALTRQIAEDGEAQHKLGLDEVTEEDVQAALLSGVLHDMALAFGTSALPVVTPLDAIAALVAPEEVAKFSGKTQFAKDVIGDDLRGAVLLDRYGGAFSEGVRGKAYADLLAGADLTVRSGGHVLLNTVSPYKVLDALWYHDGNLPVRGFAEAYPLVYDRAKLFLEGRINQEELQRGIKKLLAYTEEDPAWEQRDTAVDVPYLEKMVKKKAGDFMELVKGTQTYQFVVDELAAQGRGKRTLNSPVFCVGVDAMQETLSVLDRAISSDEETLRTLHSRYERVCELVQQYR